jgi:hypothetical protein
MLVFDGTLLGQNEARNNLINITAEGVDGEYCMQSFSSKFLDENDLNIYLGIPSNEMSLLYLCGV